MLTRTRRPYVYQYLLSASFSPDGQMRLQRRLRKGHVVLSAVLENWLATGGLSESEETLLLNGLELWDRLDAALRGIYGYMGCVVGAGKHCPDASPIRCRACGQRCDVATVKY